MLTITRNDLVKAVAAVNKNVIVVGECAFRCDLENTLLTAYFYSQQLTVSDPSF